MLSNSQLDCNFNENTENNFFRNDYFYILNDIFDKNESFSNPIENINDNNKDDLYLNIYSQNQNNQLDNSKKDRMEKNGEFKTDCTISNDLNIQLMENDKNNMENDKKMINVLDNLNDLFKMTKIVKKPPEILCTSCFKRFIAKYKSNNKPYKTCKVCSKRKRNKYRKSKAKE